MESKWGYLLLLIPVKIWALKVFNKRWPWILGWLIHKGVKVEAKVFEGGIGTNVKYKLEIKPDGKIVASLIGDVDAMAELVKLAEKTETKWDDKIVGFIKMALGLV